MASTCLNEQGWHPDLIELQLAHAERNKVRAAQPRNSRRAPLLTGVSVKTGQASGLRTCRYLASLINLLRPYKMIDNWSHRV